MGKEIVKGCKGVSLALNTLGSMLHTKHEESEWLSIKNHRICAMPPDENGILSVLKLSYEHLPIYLKQCFAFYSLFPKDYEFVEEELIQLWLAQGYIQPSSECHQLDYIVHLYFEELVSRCFFQDVEKDHYDKM